MVYGLRIMAEVKGKVKGLRLKAKDKVKGVRREVKK